MLNSSKKKLAISSAVVISILILGLLQNIKFAHAQDYEEEITLPQTFILTEISEHNETGESVDFIDIHLPSSDWNVSDIELKFTDINFTRQNLTVAEWTAGGYPPLVDIQQTQAYAVQINISSTTKIYGVQIYGRAYKRYPGDIVNIQIQGYDESKNAPNGNINFSQPINMSENVYKWWNQRFSSPITLTKGNYSLVLNVTDTILVPAIYHWGYNNFNPKHPELYVSPYSGSWSNGVQDQPLLYKLDQELIEDFYPEDYNMKAEINGIPRKIFNGSQSGTGNLTLSNIDFPTESETLHIPIIINKPYTFDFNYSYQIRLKRNIHTDGSVIINTNKKIQWNVNFNLNRSDGNYTVKFSYPNSWTSFSVLKNDNPLTHLVDYINNTNEKTIYILNDTIPYENVPWEITAESLNIPIDFNGPDPNIIAGTESISGVDSPLNGNYTYLLYVGEYEKYRNSTSYNGEPLPGDILSFSHVIPDTGPNGDWTAVIYWNNETDAGVETSVFTVSGGVTIISGDSGGDGGGGTTTVTGIDPLLVTIISIIIIASVVAALASYQTVRSVKKKRDLELQKLHNRFIDILSLNYLLVVDKKTGLNVYEQFFAGKKIDASLISGFFEAIRNFGIELTGTYTQSQSVKLEYQESKIIMSEFRNFRLIFVMTENPSEDFLTTITDFSYDIEEKFGVLLQEFKGDTTKFRDIRKLVEKNFYVSFIVPLTVRDVSDMKLKDAEIAMINKAKAIMKQNNLNYFFTSFLLPEQTYDPKKTRTIFNLIDKKIFIPTKLT